MKSFSLLVLAVLFSAFSSFAQNTFPATGNVGIGISNPSTQLYINSSSGPVLTLDKTGVQAWRVDLSQGADLRFWNQSVGTAPLTLHSSGNVGVGTTNPGYKLDVWGGLVSSANNGQAGLHIYNGGGNSEWLFQQKSQADPSLYISKLVSGTQYDYMTVNNAGNVGIGTTSLAAKFNVYQSTPLGSTIKNASLLSSVAGLCGTGNTFQNNIWLVRNSAGSDWYSTRLHDGISVDVSFLNPQTNTRTWWERDPNQNVQSWGDGANTYMSIVQGNVAIGTTDPKGYKLAVNGNVIATSMTVKLYANWPDYVFKPSYQLPSLTDVKTYINQNQHLPDMPSQEQVAKDGLNLGEMNKLLLKKMEEMTLYMIEAKEEINELKKQVQDLKKRVK
ncbi:hypothetical protein ACFGVS_01625 [Mucilaginibacter sp. AW1-7]|uniref:hypothetical protein n=1 Tax=Mucilaginibacter sp. AW1-7 TaxID=3349874 RepID=UPI003F734EDF